MRPATPSRAEARVHPTAVVHPNVKLGRGVVIDEYCVIGCPPDGREPGELETVVGDDTRIRSHAIVYAGVRIGRGCQLSHSVFVREETTLGDGTSLGLNALVEHHCSIGKNVRIQGQAGICEYSIIEDGAWLGPRVVLTNVCHPTCRRAKECLAGPVIRKGAILGGQVVICPGLEVGERGFVAAGAIVTKAVAAGEIVAGNPAKPMGRIESVRCKLDMLGGESPWGELGPAPKRIPMVDLGAQYQAHKNELRLALDRVVLNTRFVNGPEVREFEAAFAEFCETEHAVGVSSGTDALVLALRSLDVGAGDEVITVPHTFIATAEAILAVGARPVFVDVDPATANLDPERLEAAITPATKAVLPVHLYGRPADMERIGEIARRHGLLVVGDAAQAHGARLAGRGVATWADVTCYSFFPGKNLGAFGDGGALVTDDPEVAERARMLRDHGRDKKFVHDLVGGNHRLDTLQASVLLAKLPHLADWNAARRRIATAYREGLADLPLELLPAPPDAEHVYHQFVVLHPRRDDLRTHLSEHEISTGVHYPVPLHLQPALADLGHAPGDFPVTERLAETVLSLPMYPELPDELVARVVASLRAGLEALAPGTPSPK